MSQNTENTENSEVVVLGGGYGGVKAANRLARRAGVSVTLVNPRPDFVERIRLHQLVTGSDDAVEDFGEVLGGNVRLVVDTATLIAPAERRVHLAGGSTLAYDHLVYAVGSGASAPGVPGAAEFAHAVADLDGARRLRSALADTPATAPVIVVGAGLTGVETAAELAEAGRCVTLVCGGVLGSAADAEDVLQETWLRWTDVDLAQVRDRRAYLVRITTRQALNRLRTLKRRKETYVGPWLPEPLLTAPDVAEDAELAESLSLALALRPAVGADKVLRYMAGSLGKAGGTLTGEATTGIGNPGLVLRLDGGIDGVLAARVEDGRVTRIYYVRNPEKLTRVESETVLAGR
ncbi:FAD-dependent oxidoreductase [Streptomyces althioticus]